VKDPISNFPYARDVIIWRQGMTTAIEHDHWFGFKDPDGNELMNCQC